MLECDCAPSSQNRLSFSVFEKAPAGALPSLWPLKTAASSTRSGAKRPKKYTDTIKHKDSIRGEIPNSKVDHISGVRAMTDFERHERVIASLGDLKLYVNHSIYPQPDTKLGLIFADTSGRVQAEYYVNLEEETYSITHVISIAAKSLSAKKIYCVQFTERDPYKNPWINKASDLIPAVNRSEVKIEFHVVVYGRLIMVKST